MALWRRLWTTCKKLESRRTPPGIHNLEAMHTLALFWSMLGMIAPVWVSARTYLSSTPYFLNATSASVVPRNGASYVTDLSKELPSNEFIDTPIGVEFIIPCAEPFAALANLAYFTAGLGLYMMPFLSGDFMPAPVFGVAIFLCVLGACSMAFHADASQLFTWKHACRSLCDVYALCFHVDCSIQWPRPRATRRPRISTLPCWLPHECRRHLLCSLCPRLTGAV